MNGPPKCDTHATWDYSCPVCRARLSWHRLERGVDTALLHRKLNALALEVPAAVYDDFAPDMRKVIAFYEGVADNEGASE